LITRDFTTFCRDLDGWRRKSEHDFSMSALPERLLADLPAGVRRGVVGAPDDRRLPSGRSDLDLLLGGGFPRGRLSEITGPPSSGRTSIAWAILADATRRGEVVGLVDGADRFDPVRAAATGIDLERLLWIRLAEPSKALRAAEILLGTRGFAVVVLDMADGMPLPERSVGAWPRLAHRAATSRAALLLVSSKRLAEGFAAVCLSLTPGRRRWPRHRLRKLLFDGLSIEARLVRSRSGVPGGRVELDLSAD
jgi:hypothetical protein